MGQAGIIIALRANNPARLRRQNVASHANNPASYAGYSKPDTLVQLGKLINCRDVHSFGLLS